MNTDIQAQAEVAAQWWVDRMTPLHSDMANIGGEEGLFVAMFQTMNALDNVNQITDADYAEFKAELIACIVEEAAQRPDNYYIQLGVDYDPQGALRTALQRTSKGKEMTSLLPYKHRMSITPKEVEAAAGYAADWVILWSKPNEDGE